MAEDPVLQVVMSAQAQVQECAKGLDALIKKFNCVPVVVETKRGGVTVQQGIDWVPAESLQQSKIIRPV